MQLCQWLYHNNINIILWEPSESVPQRSWQSKFLIVSQTAIFIRAFGVSPSTVLNCPLVTVRNPRSRDEGSSHLFIPSFMFVQLLVWFSKWCPHVGYISKYCLATSRRRQLLVGTGSRWWSESGHWLTLLSIAAHNFQIFKPRAPYEFNCYT